jgi:hypothetical protein
MVITHVVSGSSAVCREEPLGVIANFPIRLLGKQELLVIPYHGQHRLDTCDLYPDRRYGLVYNLLEFKVLQTHAREYLYGWRLFR